MKNKTTSTWQSKREAERKKAKLKQTLIYSGIGLAVVAVIVVIAIASSSGGIMGEQVAIASSAHVEANTDPGPYSSNPPAGGEHFAESWGARFYEESDMRILPPHPEGYLVHSLEHGYVIFWYNCQLEGVDCDALKQTIREVMDATGNTKLIAFPWSTMDVPLAMTSWGRLMKFDKADAGVMKKFVQNNRYKAPEPDAN